MKNFKDLVRQLPSKSVVFTYSSCNPPTVGTEYLFKSAKKIAESLNAETVNYTDSTQNKKNPLISERKEYYSNLAFPGIDLHQTNSLLEAVKDLSKKYKSITLVTDSELVLEQTKLLSKYNVNVISAGDRELVTEDVCNKAAAKGDYTTFKSNLPSAIRDIDAKLMMNEIRQSLNLEPIREQVKFDVDDLREQYFRKQIFNVGQIVESKGQTYEIIARGSNYLTVVDSNGNTSKKWIQECSVVTTQIEEDISVGYAPEEISFKGYTTKNLHHSADAAKAFQSTIERYGKSDPMSVLTALKSTDAYMKLNDMHLEQGKAPDDAELAQWRDAHQKARESLQRIGEFQHHMDYWHNHEHEIQDMEGNYNPESAGAEMSESIDSRVTVDKNSNYNAAKDVMRYSDFKKLLKMNKGQVDEKKTIVTDMDDNDPNDQDDNAEDQAAVPVQQAADVLQPHTAVGHSMHTGLNDQLRRMKVKYKLGEETVEEDVYTSDYKINAAGRKYHPHRINFKNSKNNAEPLENDDDESVKEAKDLKLKKSYPIKADPIGGGDQNKGFDAFFLEDNAEIESEKDDDGVSDEALDKIADEVKEIDDIIDAYEDDELSVVDDEGEEVEDLKEEALNEVLSRMERIRAKVRFARTKAKRERKVQLALKRHSDTKTINRRARKLAISLIKKRLARKNLSKLSTGEKERLETFIQKRKNLVNRLAMKLTPRIRKIEQTRLSHDKFTKSN